MSIDKKSLKVLSVPWWVSHHPDDLTYASPDLLKTTPVLNRNGYYYDRKSGKTWIEFDNKAWDYSTPEAFKSDLNHIDPEMETGLYEDLLSIVEKYKISFKNLHNRFWNEYRTRELRDIGRSARMTCLGILNKKKKKRIKIGE